ncbi:MAG: hypothetical protein ACTSVI_07630 [Promethearchaeota archaeon]
MAILHHSNIAIYIINKKIFKNKTKFNCILSKIRPGNKQLNNFHELHFLNEKIN